MSSLKQVPLEPVAITVQCAITTFSIGKTRIYELLASGAIQSYKVGKKRLLDYSSILSWLSTQQDQQGGAR